MLLAVLLHAFGCWTQPSAYADDLTLYFFKSRGLDWSTPSTILGSVIKNYLLQDDYIIGHATIEVKCSPEGGGEHFHTGMSFKHFNVFKDELFNKGAGVSVLLSPVEGAVEKSKTIARYLREDAPSGRVSFVRFLINPKTCVRLTEYYHQYQERGIGKWYGLPQRPRYGEGSGCSAFAVSFLELAGLMKPEYSRDWSYHIRVPKKWMGPPFNSEKVSPWHLWWSAKRWAKATEPHEELFFWEPDKMAEWVKHKHAQAVYHPELGLKPLHWGKSKGVLIDAHDVATPVDPIWKY